MKTLLIIGLLCTFLASCSKPSAGPAFEPYFQGPVYAKVNHHEHF